MKDKSRQARSRYLRPALPEEAGPLSRLAYRAKAGWGYEPAFMEACRDVLRFTEEDTASIVVEEEKGVLLGFGLYNKQEQELTHLFVDPAFQGSGTGKRLFETIVSSLAAGTVFQIKSDPGACGFYERLGAVRTGSVFSEIDPDRQLPLLEYRR
ncbi:GNAT family N-acetyltransferase [Alkalicoccus urumqiensis]|uniref:GNAT family N-acetyltransferase n=1 Tax=Alkalicoccus urumqiensis TaxID=1548213 RepID=A0A2P6MLF4_ALKUR|nr:GNAT family N-acetyltransferase [Alkalicoccus urumqiensis]PRO67108.1 GNAT family N-acetyltransferase [Alkalicoccus urumqiensis]